MSAPLPLFRSDLQPRHTRLPIGAEVLADGAGVMFRVWAPQRRTVEAVLYTARGESPLALQPQGEQGDGHFCGVAPEARAGTRYRFRLDGGLAYPDPASRFQPEGPHGPSEVIDPRAFGWTDARWRGLPLAGQVLYELHVGTFTAEGTWAAAACELAPLADGPWQVIWSSQDARYGGVGGLAPDAAELDRRIPGRALPRPFDNWRLQGETALFLAKRPATPEPPAPHRPEETS